MRKRLSEVKKYRFYSSDIIFHQPLSANAKLVYMYLCRCANAQSECFPSHTTIGKMCSLSRPTVMKAIKELEETGLIEKINRTRKDQGKTSNLYIIYAPTPAEESDEDTPCKEDLHTPHVNDFNIPKTGSPQGEAVPTPHDNIVVYPCKTSLHGHDKTFAIPGQGVCHEGIPNKGLNDIKSINHSVKDHGSTMDREIDNANHEVFEKILENTGVLDDPVFEPLWLPVLEHMVYSPAFREQVNRPWSIIKRRLEKLTRDALVKTSRQVDMSIRLNGTHVRNPVAYLAVALYNNIGTERTHNSLAFAAVEHYVSSYPGILEDVDSFEDPETLRDVLARKSEAW